MKYKKYRSIKEVSEMLDINSHVIRYWDSKFEGISTRLKSNKQRFFNNDNIKKISHLKKILYNNGKKNFSLEIANSIIDNNFETNHKVDKRIIKEDVGRNESTLV